MRDVLLKECPCCGWADCDAMRELQEEMSPRTAPTSAAGATKPDELTSSPEPAPSPASGLLPVAREGLSDEQIDVLIQQTADPQAFGTMAQRLHRLARAIEAAHGIAPASGDAPGEAK